MKVQTFMGKASVAGLQQMDCHINDWMTRTGNVPVQIKQSFGFDRHHDGRQDEPVVVISVWYNESEPATRP